MKEAVKAVEKEEAQEIEVSDEVMKSLTGTVEELVNSKVEKAMEQAKEKAVVKNINSQAKDVNIKSVPLSKEEKFHKWIIAVKQNDFQTLREIKEEEKAAGSTSSLSPLVPPTEFISEVFRLEDSYGVAQQFADVRRTDRTSITMILGNDDIEVSIVGEGAFKPSKKLAYLPFELTFRKGVGIIPLTDELVEDSAVNVWNDAVQRVARAFSRKKDEFVFTDATSGITNQSGVNDVFVGSTPGFDDLNNAMYGSVEEIVRSGRFYFHHTWLGHFQKIQDQEQNYIWRPGPNGPADGTIWGRPYSFASVMPSVQEAVAGDNDPIAVYGDLKYVLLGERTSMKVDMSNSAIVGDPDAENQLTTQLNSWTQDLTSMRVSQRFDAKVKFPSAFSVLRLGSGS
jgi:HK97 family phage major capsid protein